MRTSEELVEELHRRIKERRRAKARRKFRLICASSGCLCLAVVILFAVAVSRMPALSPGEGPVGTAAGIFAFHPALGYVVVGLLAFCQGILLTAFCSRLKKYLLEDTQHDRDD